MRNPLPRKKQQQRKRNNVIHSDISYKPRFSAAEKRGFCFLFTGRVILNNIESAWFAILPHFLRD